MIRASRRRPAARQDPLRALALAGGVVVLVLVLVLVGCNVSGGGDDPSPTPSAEVDPNPTVAATEPAAASVVNGTPGAGPVSLGGMTISEVVWSTAVDPATQAPTDPVSAIPDDAAELYAVVSLTGLQAGTVITASWTYEGIAVDALTSSVTASEPMAETWVSFRLNQVETSTPAVRAGSGWPDGEYGIVVTVDGQVVQESTVAVQRPE